MELVYLWVEEYKNIHRQGFNFLPKFNCHYDGETLTIKDNVDENGNKQYIDNFFGDKINVTVIVGKNGSGKSSVLEILKILGKNNYETSLPAVLFVKEKENYYYISMEDNPYSIVKNEKKIELKKYELQINVITHTSDILNLFLLFNQDDRIYDLGNNMSLQSYKYSVPIDDLYWDTFKLDIMKYRTISQTMIAKYFFTKNEIEFFKPDKYAVHCRNTYLIRNIVEVVSYFSEDDMNTIKRNVEDLISSCSDCQIKIKIYLLLIQLQSNNGSEAQLYNAYKNKKLLDSETIDAFLKNKTNYINKYIVDNIKYDTAYSLREKHEVLLKVLEDKYAKDIFSDLLQIHLFEEKTGKTYKDLSSGEKDFIFLLSFLNFYLRSNQNNLILLDEVEAFTHPQWSKNIIKAVWQLLENKRCHLVLTTHSPFLLSDIPKQNIIFLDTHKEKDKEVKNGEQKAGNCKVVDGLHDKQETFGQNIHTLLSDSFFMEDGLMGEFAKSKINEIIGFHKEVEKIKDDIEAKESLRIEYEKKEEGKPSKKMRFRNTQSIIGDAYLKQVIKNHLVDIETILLGKDWAKKEEIKRVEAYLESLKK